MRIVAGTARGRRLAAPRGTATRPTSDKVRGAVFDVLGQFFEGGRVLDLYAGSGALALEALSRGFARATCVEADRRAADALARNVEACGFAGRVEIRRERVEDALARLPAAAFDLVFLDPPYADGPQAVLAALPRLLAPGRPGRGRARSAPPAGGPVRAPGPRRPARLGRYGSLDLPAGVGDTLRPMPRKAIYPGSFDPLTNGHLAIIQRGLKIFDGLVVAVLMNPSKTPLFTVQERKDLIRAAVGDDPRVEVDSFDSLLVTYAKRRGIHTVLRGLRAVSDFEYEFQLANVNRKLDPEFESVFVMTGEDYFFVTGKLVREVASFGGDVSGMVPPVVAEGLRAKFAGKARRGS